MMILELLGAVLGVAAVIGAFVRARISPSAGSLHLGLDPHGKMKGSRG